MGTWLMPFTMKSYVNDRSRAGLSLNREKFLPYSRGNAKADKIK